MKNSYRLLWVLLPLIPYMICTYDPRVLGALNLNPVLAAEAFHYAFPLTMVLTVVLGWTLRKIWAEIISQKRKAFVCAIAFLFLSALVLLLINVTASWTVLNPPTSESRYNFYERLLYLEYTGFFFWMFSAFLIAGVHLAYPSFPVIMKLTQSGN